MNSSSREKPTTDAATSVPSLPQTPELAQRPAVPTTCIEHQAGRPTLRLSFQIKVF